MVKQSIAATDEGELVESFGLPFAGLIIRSALVFDDLAWIRTSASEGAEKASKKITKMPVMCVMRPNA